MASFFNLILDTTAPSGLTLSINNGAAVTTSRTVTLTIGVADADTTGYQMLIWGTDGVATEAAATWESYATTKSVTLPSGDGTKIVYIKVRDAVGNAVAAAVSDTITLDMTVPVVTISTAPDNSTISATGTITASMFKFTVSEAFQKYAVMVVSNTSALHDSEGSVQIGTAGGSTNMSGTRDLTTEQPFPANTEITCIIKGADLAAASAGDGTKIIKVFAQDANGLWSEA